MTSSNWTYVNPLSLQHPTHFFSQGLNPFAPPLTTTEILRKEEYMENKRYNQVLRVLFDGNWTRSHLESTPKDGIGLEIECEGENLFMTPLSYWSVHNDGSLRATNGHPPAEYVLNKPLTRDDLPKALEYLTGKLKGSKVLDSPRTSVHVHMNCLELTVKQIITWVCLYLCLEDLIVEYGGANRVGNMFCLRVKDAEQFLFTLRDCIQSDSYSSLGSDNLRYTSCNVSALHKFGSLEFRALRGTVNQEVILQWVNILTELKTSSLKLDNPQQVVSWFESVKHDPKLFLRQVLPTYYYLFIQNPGLKQMIWDAIRRVRDIAWAIPEWEQARSEKVRKKKTKQKYISVDGQIILNTEWDIDDA